MHQFVEARRVSLTRNRGRMTAFAAVPASANDMIATAAIRGTKPGQEPSTIRHLT